MPTSVTLDPAHQSMPCGRCRTGVAVLLSNGMHECQNPACGALRITRFSPQAKVTQTRWI